MAFVSTIDVIGSGFTAQQQRLDVISENIVNMNTTRTENSDGSYHRKAVTFQAAESRSHFRSELVYRTGLTRAEAAESINPRGVIVSAVGEYPSNFKLKYDPEDPDANEDGYVELPNMDMVKEITDGYHRRQPVAEQQCDPGGPRRILPKLHNQQGGHRGWPGIRPVRAGESLRQPDRLGPRRESDQVHEGRKFAFMDKADIKSLYSALQNERPQTMALVLSYVDPDKAVGVIEQLEPSRQIKVVEAIATMESASPTAIKTIEAEMERKFSSIITQSNVKVGGIDYVANIMNNLDRSSEESIFDGLSVRNADVSNKLFTNMSSRMAESIRDNLEVTTNVRMKDAEDVQQRIVDVIRDLEERNEIIMKGGKDDIIA